MIRKYLQEFYTFKAIVPRSRIQVMEPSNDLEEELQKQILDGNSAFFKFQYQKALDHYLDAWGLLPN